MTTHYIPLWTPDGELTMAPVTWGLPAADELNSMREDEQPNTTMSAQDAGEIVEAVLDVADDEKVQPNKVAKIVSEVIEFVMHCFKCKNPKGGKLCVRKDSVELKKKKNAFQAVGVCASCGKKVTGFIPAAQAKELGLPIEEEPVKEKKRKERETVTVDSVLPMPKDKKRKAKKAVTKDPAPEIPSAVPDSAPEAK